LLSLARASDPDERNLAISLCVIMAMAEQHGSAPQVSSCRPPQHRRGRASCRRRDASADRDEPDRVSARATTGSARSHLANARAPQLRCKEHRRERTQFRSERFGGFDWTRGTCGRYSWSSVTRGCQAIRA
jgi:hypothetical protein